MIVRSEGNHNPCQQGLKGQPLALDISPGNAEQDIATLQAVHESSTGHGVDVAVIDTGSATPGVHGDRDMCFLHGSAVATVISTLAPGARITSFKHSAQSHTPQGTVAELVQALTKATAAGAKIINISMVACTDTRELRDAITGAHAQGALVVASTGNTGQCEGGATPFPAAIEGVLAVGAVDSVGINVPGGPDTSGVDAGRVPAAYSAPTPYVDIFAPGGPISAVIDAPGAGPTTLIGDPAPFIGTSYAAPFVTGTAALIWQAAPHLQPHEVASILLTTATPGGAAGAMTDPIKVVNAPSAVAAAQALNSPHPEGQATALETKRVEQESVTVTGQGYQNPGVDYSVPLAAGAVMALVTVVVLVCRAFSSVNKPPSAKPATTAHGTSTHPGRSDSPGSSA